MNKNPLVSNVILTQNALEYTKLCIESIQNAKTNIPFEIIIIDNNSNDKTKQYLRNVNAVKCFSKSNLGVAEGRNLGFALVSKSTEFVCFLDNDTVVSDYWLDEFLDVMEENSEIGIIGASSNVRKVKVNAFSQNLRKKWFSFVKESTSLSAKKQLEKFYPIGVNNFSLRERSNPDRRKIEVSMPPDYIPGWCQFFRKGIVKNLPYDIAYPAYSASDIDFSWNIAKRGYKAIYNEKVFVHHFKGQSTIAKNPRELSGDSLRGYALLSSKWERGIIGYLSATKKKQKNSPYMSGSMVQYLVNSFGFFVYENKQWKINQKTINQALST